MKAEIEGVKTNVMLDTGAGVSIVDIGTFKHLKLANRIIRKRSNKPVCFDASGNQMNIISTIE